MSIYIVVCIRIKEIAFFCNCVIVLRRGSVE